MLSHWYLLSFTFAVLLRVAYPRSPSAHDTTLDAHNVHRRGYISPSQKSAAYDFVIAGGGLAGLVLAARLSDDSNKTVLVIEAGPSGDEVADRISEKFVTTFIWKTEPLVDTPSGTYYQSLLGSGPYSWMYTTAPQANVSARMLAQPRGKVRSVRWYWFMSTKSVLSGPWGLSCHQWHVSCASLQRGGQRMA